MTVQSISSGVYLHIRQHLLAPTAVSLTAGIPPDILSEDIFLSVIAFVYGKLYISDYEKSTINLHSFI